MQFRNVLKQSVLALALASAAGLAAAASETYVIEPTHTLPKFSYNHFGYSTQSSVFTKTSGKITLDRAARKGSVNVTIDAKSVSTGVPLFNEHIQAADFFDTAMFDTITFASDKMNFDGDKPASVDGKLTIKGVTKPVTLKITSFHCMPHPMVKKDACGANAETIVKRSDFNMGKYAPYVSDEVTLTIPVEAIKE
jgi:polyisoprenoid-binding protein YceI